MREHPSGQPIRRDEPRSGSSPRIPRDEPLTPRLRRREGVEAIGFVTRFDASENSDAEDA